ncbi:MAG: DUF86 domain-containing protein [Melioribacteraceae bacterium]|jgi:uncharacterized protein with HEPN domain|nr:DUF86 domain-containing protein [Melioribacteraceae bacterium]
MYDIELVREVLNNILWSINQILRRSENFNSYEQFLDNDYGLEKLDSICMQLINIGEALKEIDKLTGGSLLLRYPEVDWTNAKGMRDIITHHYFDIDAEIVFAVIKDKLPQMKEVIKQILNSID